VQLNFEELRELLTTLDQTAIAELTLKSEDFELTIRREIANPQAGLATAFVGGPVLTPAPITPVTPTLSPDAGVSPVAPVTPSPTTPPTPPPGDRKLLEITSPMVGTFYRAPAPDEPPFVDTGDRIRSGQTVCIIEAMKLMNELESEVAGEIVEILVQNGQPVEYGQVLMRVNPG
jgi:acetyl-CoA carboxylase biotin carboxyl carrier protein